jgi:AAA domain
VRTLFFDSASGNPKVAKALMGQADVNLRPFGRFLDQAIHTAKQRSTRYQLPWARAGGLQHIALEAMDRRVLVPRRGPAWHITDWPADVEPDPDKKLMVTTRDLMFSVIEYRPDRDMLWVRPDGELRDDDVVFWCGRACTIAREPPTPTPSSVLDAVGAHLRLTGEAQPDEHGWILVVQGWRGTGDLVVDGETVTPTILSPMDGLRRVRDTDGRSFELTGGKLVVEEPPAEGPLTGDNGVRFAQKSAVRSGGTWVQLLPPETEDPDDFVDPRAAFCEDEVQEVLTGRRGPGNVFKVRRIDRDRYQLLLDRFPTPGTRLSLPVDIWNLQLQRRALRQLMEAPLPHHAGLLRLCEHPEWVRWPKFAPRWPETWAFLTDESRSGTAEQRAFVAKALGSPDIALLEGPPGSGKTTAICEIIQQLLVDGQRVLLCASTHNAIDNVLERLIKSDAPLDIVRIGRTDRIDPTIGAMQIDQKVEHLLRTWRTVPDLQELGDGELLDAAKRVVINAANLTCGTPMGIAQHPLLRGSDSDGRQSERPITTMPHWDVLIIDEASKTLIQEFLVPALMAKRCIVVGDIHQLPPFTERADIVANLRCLQDHRRHELFPADHQRACLLLDRMARRPLRRTGARWLVVEPPGVLDWIGREILARPDFPVSVVRVVGRHGGREGGSHEVSVEELLGGAPAALAVAAYDWVLVSDDLLRKVADRLPSDLLHHRDLTRGEQGIAESDQLLFRHAWWLTQAAALRTTYRERGTDICTYSQAETHEQRWLRDHDLANELAWRLTRTHELKHSQNRAEPDRLAAQLCELQPRAVDISESLAEIQDIGLPSILEVLQEGIGAQRTKRASALTEGMPVRQPDAFQARFGSLSYQHRMHPVISRFPREVFYSGTSLRDANTISIRDAEIAWTFGDLGNRRVIWADVRGREDRGTNLDEVGVMKGIVKGFLAWAQQAGLPRRSSPPLWEVACLCFYNKQALAISAMLREVTGDDRQARFSSGNVELVSGTVDRFQGREADLVLLSMRNTRRIGFLDSRNRLNVALTRARQQLFVVGNADYFSRCQIAELEELVRRSSREDARRWSRERR